jgi:hypothetical protein
VALGNDANLKVIDQFGDDLAHPVPDTRSGTGKERQIFRQHLVRRDYPLWLKRTADIESAGMGRIIDGSQSSPVKRVGENGFQSALLGTP